MQGALAHMERPHTQEHGQALVGPIDRLGELERLVAIGHPVGKGPQLAEALHQVRTRLDRSYL